MPVRRRGCSLTKLLSGLLNYLMYFSELCSDLGSGTGIATMLFARLLDPKSQPATPAAAEHQRMRAPQAWCRAAEACPPRCRPAASRSCRAPKMGAELGPAGGKRSVLQA